MVSERFMSLIAIAARFENPTLSPSVGVLRSVMSAVLSTVPDGPVPCTTATPATSLVLGALTSHRLTVTGAPADVTVPVPTWQPVVGVDEIKQAPPA